ncbi:hypothetical protein GCM10022281_10350 [Sphingomonas rosea]|uniref:Peptidase M15A C-terminal domain-containing protein n=1 Tax=Sphingomonas rosea TaxID=335605 RepID=A0ABP7TX74_9SPHN
MRFVAFTLAASLLAVPATAQAPVAPALSLWNPAADYVEAGQDEPGYRRWIAQGPWRAGAVTQFHQYLTNSGVAFIAPTWQLLRTASDWRRCGAEPFEIPPTDEWPNIVNTLRYVRDHVVPRVGPVEPVSVFRNAGLNRCAGGAPESVHRSMSAIDFVPLAPIGREDMIHRLCAEHQVEGPRYNAGLGFYTKMRFHIDSWKYRTWGRDDSGHIACPKVEQPVPVLAKAPQPATSGAASALVFRTPPAATAATPVSTATTVSTGTGDPLAPLPDGSAGR